MVLQDFGDESDNKEGTAGPSFNEWECPLCNANNPADDGMHEGEEVRCCYCGAEFRVHIDQDGRLKLKES